MTTPLASTLLIDDEDHLATPLRAAFHDENLGLDVARTWSEGMDLFQVVGHELVVADYDLRESQTGLRLLAEIRRLAPSTRLILISGQIPASADDEIGEQAAVDIYLRRTDPNFLDTILDEAEQAALRAGASDWVAVGKARPDADEVDMDDVARIEQQLRSRLGGE